MMIIADAVRIRFSFGGSNGGALGVKRSAGRQLGDSCENQTGHPFLPIAARLSGRGDRVRNMGIDLLSLTIGYGACLASVGFGSALSHAKQRRRAAAGIVSRCSCKHTVAYHNPETGACHAEICTDRLADRWAKCSCQRYDGPPLVTDFFVPELPGKP
ncbi:hypothetical protein [Nocardia sp. NPDC057030]|uniref:hypothetical protein n=1 Tax=unclassified Nocardia TaxID=2637762 RepID=UPI00363AB52B